MDWSTEYDPLHQMEIVVVIRKYTIRNESLLCRNPRNIFPEGFKDLISPYTIAFKLLRMVSDLQLRYNPWRSWGREPLCWYSYYEFDLSQSSVNNNHPNFKQEDPIRLPTFLFASSVHFIEGLQSLLWSLLSQNWTPPKAFSEVLSGSTTSFQGLLVYQKLPIWEWIIKYPGSEISICSWHHYSTALGRCWFQDLAKRTNTQEKRINGITIGRSPSSHSMSNGQTVDIYHSPNRDSQQEGVAALIWMNNLDDNSPKRVFKLPWIPAHGGRMSRSFHHEIEKKEQATLSPQ